MTITFIIKWKEKSMYKKMILVVNFYHIFLIKISTLLSCTKQTSKLLG